MAAKADTRRTDKAKRSIGAQSEEIYKAFTSASSLMKWLPPKGMSGRALIYEFRVGGRYRIELLHNEKEQGVSGKTTDRADVSEGRFIELVPGRSIKQSVNFESNDPTFAGEMTMTWSFEPVSQGTDVTITADNVPPGIRKADHDAGLKSTLDNLAKFVEPK